jgi:hypothetical protein
MKKIYVKKLANGRYNVWYGTKRDNKGLTECATKELASETAHSLMHVVGCRVFEMINDHWEEGGL